MSSLRVPLIGALLLLLAAAVVTALLPAGMSLDRRVSGEIRRVAIEDLGRAPVILEDRNAAQSEALSMHAMTVAMADGLVAAVEGDDMDRAVELARRTAAMYGEDPVVINALGDPIVGPLPGEEALGVLQSSGSWTGYVYDAGVPRAVGLVSLASDADWAGAAGSSTAFDQELAATLSGLARSDVTILGPDGALVATTLDSITATGLGAAVRGGEGVPAGEKVDEIWVGGGLHWVARGVLTGAGEILFSRSVDAELAAVPGVRRSLWLAGFLTLLLALGVGAGAALVMVRPVRHLARAADQVVAGDFESPVLRSRVEEIDRLGQAFVSMRAALKGRIAELADANEELEEKQVRLAGLQGELIRQDRLASSARMAAELAHEIRNPVANVRNCLEVVRRRLDDDEEGSRFADMAIDELLRMHELAEHLLDLNRPADPTAGSADVRVVAEQVADLAGVGEAGVEVVVRAQPDADLHVAMPPDALKQVLFNLIDNASEAAGPGAEVVIAVRPVGDIVVVDVLDRGPGIADDVLPRIFDPFFTTKDAVTGVGLGLFVAEGLVRRHGGRMEAVNRDDGLGARFSVEIPVGEEVRA